MLIISVKKTQSHKSVMLDIFKSGSNVVIQANKEFSISKKGLIMKVDSKKNKFFVCFILIPIIILNNL